MKWNQRCISCDTILSPTIEDCPRCGLRQADPTRREECLNLSLAAIPWMMLIGVLLFCLLGVLAWLGAIGGAMFVM